jgi:hypothetical protein
MTVVLLMPRQKNWSARVPELSRNQSSPAPGMSAHIKLTRWGRTFVWRKEELERYSV